jgi:hypothetical protein
MVYCNHLRLPPTRDLVVSLVINEACQTHSSEEEESAEIMALFLKSPSAITSGSEKRGIYKFFTYSLCSLSSPSL